MNPCGTNRDIFKSRSNEIAQIRIAGRKIEIPRFSLWEPDDWTFSPNKNLRISNFLPAMRICAISFDRDLKMSLFNPPSRTFRVERLRIGHNRVRRTCRRRMGRQPRRPKVASQCWSYDNAHSRSWNHDAARCVRNRARTLCRCIRRSA